MAKYIDAEKLIAELRRQKRELEFSIQSLGDFGQSCQIVTFENILSIITSLQQEQPSTIIQWTGHNLKEVIDFTGKSPRLGEWFKSWEEYENYVHTHNDILKLFFEDGSHYEVPVGAWIVKTPDGYITPSRFRFIQKPTDNVSKEEYVKRFKALCDAYEIKLPNREYDIYGLCKDLHKLFGDIQKPAEWSEEEKRKLNRIYAILRQAADTHAFSTTCRLIGDKEAIELQDFLRSIANPAGCRVERGG